MLGKKFLEKERRKAGHEVSRGRKSELEAIRKVAATRAVGAQVVPLRDLLEVARILTAPVLNLRGRVRGPVTAPILPTVLALGADLLRTEGVTAEVVVLPAAIGEGDLDHILILNREMVASIIQVEVSKEREIRDGSVTRSGESPELRTRRFSNVAPNFLLTAWLLKEMLATIR